MVNSYEAFVRVKDQTFARIFRDARHQFDVFLAGENRPTIEQVLQSFKADKRPACFTESFYMHVTQRQCNEKAVREFYSSCPPFQALIFALWVSVYERCVRDERRGPSYRAEGTDVLAATYLPYCDEFVTADPKQERCMRAIAPEAVIKVQVRSYTDFKARLLQDFVATNQ